MSSSLLPWGPLLGVHARLTATAGISFSVHFFFDSFGKVEEFRTPFRPLGGRWIIFYRKSGDSGSGAVWECLIFILCCGGLGLARVFFFRRLFIDCFGSIFTAALIDWVKWRPWRGGDVCRNLLQF